MARKRKSSEAIEAQHPTVEMTGKNNRLTGEDLQQDFDKFCQDANLVIRKEHHKNDDDFRGSIEGQVEQLYRYLWWQNRHELQNEVNSFFRSLPSTPDSHLAAKKLELLLDRLRILRINTPQQKQKFARLEESKLASIREPDDQPSDEDLPDAPPSPTPGSLPRPLPTDSKASFGLKASFKTTKTGVSASRSQAGPESTSRVLERHVPNKFDRDHPAITKPVSPSVFSMKQSSLAHKGSSESLPYTAETPAGVPKTEAMPTGANTSFASTNANTSFGQPGSFWSQASSQHTQMTSFSDEMPPPARPRKSSIAMSSLSTEGAERLVQLADQWTASQESATTLVPELKAQRSETSESPNSYKTAPLSPQRQRDLGSLSQGSIEESDYGSSIGRSTISDLDIYAEKLRAPLDHSIAVEYAAANHFMHPFDRGPTHPQLHSIRSSEMLPVMRFPRSQSRAFAQLKIPDCFSDLPYLVQWETQRLLQTGFITAEVLAAQWRIRNLVTLYDTAEALKKPFQPGFPNGELELDGVTMGGVLQYSRSNNGPIFDLLLHAPKKDKSSELQRRFGSSRVLYVDMPSMFKPPTQHAGRDIMGIFGEMLASPQEFLGRRWILYTVQPSKKTKNSVMTGANRLVFFAVDNDHVRNVFDYTIPYATNKAQPARKLYTRLELCLSRTSVGFQFSPEEISYRVDDQYATPDPDNDTFLDPALRSCKQMVDPEDNFNPETVMSDGCASIHDWVYWKIHQSVGFDRPRWAFQARIGGAKGVWLRHPDSYMHMSAKPPRDLIKLTKSQLKVLRDSLDGCEKATLSFNVVKCNSYPVMSLLHPGFMPILLDRGVLKQNILDLVETQITTELEQAEQAIEEGPAATRRWLYTNSRTLEEKNRDVGMQTLAGFPMRREERIVQMLEAGFEIKTCSYLASEVHQIIKQIFDLKRKNYKIRLCQSTTLMGVPDPLGVLKPGQVQVNFSTPFQVPGGMAWQSLRNMTGLVARNPALAAWDIQKVEFVSHPRLESLSDVVIFSSRGRRPLAGMLQGGDYDGDTFWICWDQDLTRDFCNAPCPAKPPPEETLNITKRAERLQDYVQDPDSETQWCAWIRAMAEARLKPNLLGVVTKLHERLVYTTGNLRSDQAIALVHLHDYLVDADKQGYEFDFAALGALKKQLNLPTLSEPAYWTFTKALEEDEKDTYAIDEPQVDGNVIDDAYFKVVQPAIEKALKRIGNKLAAFAEDNDPDLTKFYKQTIAPVAPETVTPVIQREMKSLKEALKEVRDFWGDNYTKLEFHDLIKECRFIYDNIKPHHLDQPTIKEWLRRCGNDLTIWDKLKASALAKFHFNTTKRGKFIFSVAGNELCELKAAHMPASRRISMEQYRMLKLRKQKSVETGDEYADDFHDIEDGEDAAVEDTEYY